MAFSLQSLKCRVAALALASLPLSALAQTTVSNAWVRATVPNQPSTGAFMMLTATSDSKLVSVASPVAGTVQIHEMTMNGDVMGMRQVTEVPLPAGKPVSLDPSGLHVMLMGLKEQVREGSQVPLTLTIEDQQGERQTLEVQAPVRALTTEGGHGQHMH